MTATSIKGLLGSVRVKLNENFFLLEYFLYIQATYQANLFNASLKTLCTALVETSRYSYMLNKQ